MLVAFYDANVLYPAELRSFLMHLALTGLFRAKWSDGVHEEWISNLLLNRPDLTREKLERTCVLMNRHAIDALVRIRPARRWSRHDCRDQQTKPSSPVRSTQATPLAGLDKAA